MHFTYFCEKWGGGQWTSVLCSPSSRIFCVFSDDVNIFGWYSRWSSSFCVFKCFCGLLGFMSDDYSFVVAFVVYLFNMDIYLYISMYIQAEYRRFGVFNFFCVNYCTCYILFLLWRVVFFRLRVAEEFLFSFRQTAYISFIIKAFIVFYYYPPLTAYIGYLHLPARASIGWFLFHNFISIFLFVTLLPFFLLVTSLTWLR